MISQPRDRTRNRYFTIRRREESDRDKKNRDFLRHYRPSKTGDPSEAPLTAFPLGVRKTRRRVTLKEFFFLQERAAEIIPDCNDIRWKVQARGGGGAGEKTLNENGEPGGYGLAKKIAFRNLQGKDTSTRRQQSGDPETRGELYRTSPAEKGAFLGERLSEGGDQKTTMRGK